MRHIPAKFEAVYAVGTSSAAWVTRSALTGYSPPGRNGALCISRDRRGEDYVWNE
jgi:hypothetical protein